MKLDTSVTSWLCYLRSNVMHRGKSITTMSSKWLLTPLYVWRRHVRLRACLRKSACFRQNVFYYTITKNQRSIMKRSLPSCKRFTGMLMCCVDSYEWWEILHIMMYLGHFKWGNHLCCSLPNYTLRIYQGPLTTERVTSAIVSNVCHYVRSLEDIQSI